jgi:ATP-dependent Clp protease protease subunit
MTNGDDLVFKTKIRSILLQGEINEEAFKHVYSEAIRLLDISNKPINVIIDTYGGYIDSMIAIHDLLKNLPCPIWTAGYGKVMSAGVLLLMCGEKGHRTVSENTSIMVHEVWGISSGKITSLEADVIETRKLHDKMLSLYGKYTNKSKEEWCKMIESKPDLFIEPQQAIEYGVIDAISSSIFGIKKND